MAGSNKEVALKIIEQMPEDASLEQIMYRLYFRERVDRGIAERDEGRMVPHEEIRRSIAKWLAT